MRAKLFSISKQDYFRGIIFLNIYSWLCLISLNTSFTKNPTFKFVFEEHSGHSLTVKIKIEIILLFKNIVKSVITGGVLLLTGRQLCSVTAE